MVQQKNSTCRACCWKNKRPTRMLRITSPKKFHLPLWRLTFPMSINVFNSNFPKKWKIFVRTVHQNFRMARQTISVSTRSIRFVSIHPIATDIATVARLSSILNITRNFVYQSLLWWPYLTQLILKLELWEFIAPDGEFIVRDAWKCQPCLKLTQFLFVQSI